MIVGIYPERSPEFIEGRSRGISTMKNKEVADLLERMGTLLEIKGEVVFKTRAYFKAAENIANLSEDIELIRRENRLEEIPESLLEVVSVPSIGPKKARLFFETLKIKSLEDLRRAAEGGRLQGLVGIQERTIENILRGIRRSEEHT